MITLNAGPRMREHFNRYIHTTYDTSIELLRKFGAQFSGYGLLGRRCARIRKLVANFDRLIC